MYVLKGQKPRAAIQSQQSQTEQQEAPKTTGNALLDGILSAIGLVSLVILMMIASCTYMGWHAVQRAHRLITIPDRIFSEGQIHDAVEQYKQIYPELVDDDDRKRALRRIITHEYGSGQKEEAAFWSDVAADEGFDFTNDIGSETSPLREIIKSAVERRKRQTETIPKESTFK